MRIIAFFSNPAHCRIEYIELINPATSQVVTLDWDESEAVSYTHLTLPTT